MNFVELLKLRRSIRNYKDQPVQEEVIMEIIKESTLSPNAGNEQPWEFVIVNNKKMLKRMSDESKKNILNRINANPKDYAGRYRGMLENDSYNVYYDAPCAVIVLGRSGLKNLFVDCALAASYFMMAATSRGLGTCWVNLGAEIRDPELIKELGVPENSKIVAPIALGYPAKIPAAPNRKEPKIARIIT
ncbi:nitroreductase family protein [candidate division KSB1 bacterium]|nr:nitroreductase family protein [candidate division KSB1 bacterium]